MKPLYARALGLLIISQVIAIVMALIAHDQERFRILEEGEKPLSFVAHLINTEIVVSVLFLIIVVVILAAKLLSGDFDKKN